MTTPATTVDPATVPDPNAPPPADPNGSVPQTVPLATHVGERKQWQGKVSSLSQRVHELETELKGKVPAPPANVTDEDKWREDALKRLGLTDKLAKLDKLEQALDAAKEHLAKGGQAHAMIVRQQERAINKATGIAEKAFDEDLKSIGFTQETWDNLVASSITDDDMDELFANPTYMKEVVARVRKIYQRNIDTKKTHTAASVGNLPRTPGPGGTPPAPPENQPLKVGKGLHARAFERLQGIVKNE